MKAPNLNLRSLCTLALLLPIGVLPAGLGR